MNSTSGTLANDQLQEKADELAKRRDRLQYQITQITLEIENITEAINAKIIAQLDHAGEVATLVRKRTELEELNRKFGKAEMEFHAFKHEHLTANLLYPPSSK